MNFTKDHVANVLLQLKFLSGKFEKQSYVFEHCEIRVPFFRRIKSVSLKPSIGSISLNQNRNAVIWIPGSKISKVEGVLSGTSYIESKCHHHRRRHQERAHHIQARLSLRMRMRKIPLSWRGKYLNIYALQIGCYVVWRIRKIERQMWRMQSVAAGEVGEMHLILYVRMPVFERSLIYILELMKYPRSNARSKTCDMCTETGTGQNCYAQIFFKITGVCLSDIGIDMDGISLHPVPKKRIRIKVERQMFGIEYLVWNELGDARYIRRWDDGDGVMSS